MPNAAFLLVTVDPVTGSGQRGSAWTLVRERLRKKRWPLYEGTPCRDRIAPGSRVAFYVGGHRLHRQTIVATAAVEEKVRWSPGRGAVDPDRYLTEAAAEVLVLRDVCYLVTPLDLRAALPNLSIRPKSLQKWGAALMGGVRELTDEDWTLLFAGAAVREGDEL